MNSRIRAYIERAPEAISGHGGHNTTLRVARTLYNGFALSRDQVLEGLHVYNARLSEKWTPRELEHKADSASTGTYDKPRGWMLGEDESEPRRIVIRPAKIANGGWKTVKKYVFATDATDVFYSQSAIHARARACARSRGESEITVASVADAEPEARRIDKEMAKIRRDTLDGLTDPDAACLAAVLVPDNGTTRWGANVLTGNAQPRTPEDCHAFLMAAFDPEDVFDFSNPADVAEFEKLYKRKL
jgi:hypothetical protein